MKTSIKVIGLNIQINEESTNEHPIFGALPTEVANIHLDGLEYSLEAEGQELIEMAEGFTDIAIEGMQRSTNPKLVGSMIQAFERFADAGRREDKKRQGASQDRRKREQSFLNQDAFDSKERRKARKERRQEAAITPERLAGGPRT